MNHSENHLADVLMELLTLIVVLTLVGIDLENTKGPRCSNLMSKSEEIRGLHPYIVNLVAQNFM